MFHRNKKQIIKGNALCCPSNKILKKMGLIFDQDGIMKRYMIENDGWKSHLRETKSFITDCLSGVKPKSVALLGSGWLLDIPVSFLAEVFDEVFFYDLRHPNSIKHKYRKQSNFRFIEMDLTGGLIEQVYQLINSKEKHSPEDFVKQLQLPPVSLPVYADYMVSINLLSQVDTLIIDYINKMMDISPDLIITLRQSIQQQHINLLKSGQSCMISDVEEINLDNNLKVIETKPLIFAQFPKGTLHKEWIWQFDTKMTYHPDYITNFKVKAIKF